MSMSPTIPGIDSLSLIVTQEIHVERSLEDHVRGAAGTDRSGERDAGTKDADDDRTVAGRPMVPRPGRQQRPSLGTRAGDQAAHAAGDHRTAVHVVRRLCRTCSTA